MITSSLLTYGGIITCKEELRQSTLHETSETSETHNQFKVSAKIIFIDNIYATMKDCLWYVYMYLMH